MAVVCGSLAAGERVAFPVPKVWSGDYEIKWGRVTLTLASDFGPANVRVAIWAPSGWRVNTYEVKDAADPLVLDFWGGDSKVSLSRDADDGDAPAGYMVQAVLQA